MVKPGLERAESAVIQTEQISCTCYSLGSLLAFAFEAFSQIPEKAEFAMGPSTPVPVYTPGPYTYYAV